MKTKSPPLAERKTIHKGYCDPYELAEANQPTIFNRPFWMGDGSPCVPVKITVSDDDAKLVRKIRRQKARLLEGERK